MVRAKRVQRSTPGRHRSPRQKLPPDVLLRLELPSNPETLCLARAAVGRAAELLHFSEEAVRAVVRAVDEGLANVLRHAYRGALGLPVELVCRRVRSPSVRGQRDGLEILVEDSGKRANPALLHGRALDDLRPGGLGIHFMRNSMDEVEFSHKHGKNVLRLVKYLSPSGTSVNHKESASCRLPSAK